MATRRWLHSHLFHSPLSNNQEVGEAGGAGLDGWAGCAGLAWLAGWLLWLAGRGAQA